MGSRLNELRSAQVVATNEAVLETFRLNTRRAQEALGVLLTAGGPTDAGDEPAFEVPAEDATGEWLSTRPDVQLFTAQRLAAARVVEDSSKDWWPTGSVSFDPQYVTPSGLFQESRTWRLSFRLTQPIYDGGERRGVRRQREASAQASTLALDRLEILARSEVRTARAAAAFHQRAEASARLAAQLANEVLKITILAFEAGSSTNIEVIDAQRSALDLETAAAQVEDALRQARLELLVALGRFPR